MNPLRLPAPASDTRAFLKAAAAAHLPAVVIAEGAVEGEDVEFVAVDENTVTLRSTSPGGPRGILESGPVSVWVGTGRLPFVFHTRIWTQRASQLKVVFPAEISTQERRLGQRVELAQRVEALLAFGPHVVRRTVESISAGGFAVLLDPADTYARPGASIDQLRLELPAEGAIVTSGTVRSVFSAAGPYGRVSVAGIAFTGLAGDAEARLRGWLRHWRARQRSGAAAPPANEDTGAHALVHTARGTIHKFPLLRLGATGAEIGLRADDADLMDTGRVALVELRVADQLVRVNVCKLTDPVSHRGRPVRASVQLWGLTARMRSWLMSLSWRGK